MSKKQQVPESPRASLGRLPSDVDGDEGRVRMRLRRNVEEAAANVGKAKEAFEQRHCDAVSLFHADNRLEYAKRELRDARMILEAFEEAVASEQEQEQGQ